MQATVKVLPDKIFNQIRAEAKVLNNIKMNNLIWTESENLNAFISIKSTEPENVKQSISILDLGKMLLQHAKDGDVVRVHDLIGKGAPFSADWLGMTALHFAAKQNHHEICEMLLRGGINKDAKTKVDRTPLHYAAYEGHEAIVELLLVRKCDINVRDMLRMTALHWAVEKKHKSIARLLIKHGADVTVVSKFDKTPLTLAVQTGQSDLLHELEQARQIQKTRENMLFDLQQHQYRISVKSETNEAVNSIALDTPTFDLSTVVAENDSITTEILKTDSKLPVKSSSNSNHGTKILNSNRNSNMDDDDISFVEPIVQLQNLDDPKNLDASALQLLKNHGISMLPAEDPEHNLLTSALQGGRKLVLSEAGKLVLNEAKIKRFSDGGPVPTTSNSNDKKLVEVQKPDMKIAKKPPVLVRAKGVPLKNKNIRIITMDMFKQMYGDDVVQNIKKISNVPKPLNTTIKPLSAISKLTKIMPLNNTIAKKPILQKVNFKELKEQPTNSNTNAQSQKMDIEDEDDLTNIIEVCSDSEIEDEKLPTPSPTKSMPIRNLNSTVTKTYSRVSSNSGTDTEIPILDKAEISRQLYELRKQTEELQKQLELSQKQSEEYKIRLERLEKERERHENYS